MAGRNQQERVDRLKDRIISLQEKALFILETASNGFRLSQQRLEMLSELTDDELRAEGHDREQVEIMLDGRKGAKDVSFAMRCAQEQNERMLRAITKDEGPSQTANDDFHVWIPAAAVIRELDVIDVTPEPED